MRLEKERIEIVEYGKKLIEKGLTKGTGGNLSIYNREEGLMAITPSGIDYFEIRPEDIVIMDLDDNIIEGEKRPSSEYGMHRILYANRNDINAVIHTHTTYATAIACLNKPLPAIHYMIALVGTDVRCAKYATYGTEELAENAFEAMKDRKACLLANHGLLVGGDSLAFCLNATEEVEYCAELYCLTTSMRYGVGKPIILSHDEMVHMQERFKDYGQRVK